MNGRVFAGARALYRAAGVKGDDMGKKPIIAIANSFDEFLPGHVHLNKVGRIVSEAIKEAGGIPREFNTMAVDDGIAMGHTGMLYSLPSRDIIADTVEYQCNAHCADALICIPNCDKVVPGMLMAALRLNIPTVFVSGGPMEAGTTILADGTKKSTDLIDVMYATADDSVSDEELLNYEKTVCPTCGSCAGMFTANSMNCLTEAIGLALPGNGTILASHSYRKDLFKRAAQQVVKIAHQYYDDSDDSVLPRSIATKEAFENAMTMDVAMGGSTNTVLHILAMAQSADVDFTLDDIERISHTVPCICKASPSGKWEISDIHRAGGITGILGELDRAGKLHTNVHSIDYPTLEAKLADWDIMRPTVHRRSPADVQGGSRPHHLSRTVDAHHAVRLAGPRPRQRRHPRHRPSGDPRGRSRRAARQPRSRRLRRQDRGRAAGDLEVPRTGTGGRFAGAGHRGDPRRHAEARHGAGDSLRRSEGRPGHAGDAVPDVLR